ncbi:LysR family transcriptional regulator [Azospirillum sp. B4]|uniref:LysR family transcriptional regulator n=1 Tax=Azospirillum sp. B4 TaxID=95605 RepID=UPI00034CCFD6|nr:LysR family transcriptional regulator [Azospirillum sp. B4]
MELNWLEDLTALAEHRNFSRAAAARHVTQPAFSRRIQALEAWVGTALVVRGGGQGVSLNAAGEVVCAQAAALTRDLHQMQRDALRAAGREGATLTIAATHALSFTFLPGWIRSVAPLETLGTLSLVSDTLAACERILLAGDADFLLCHAHAGMATALTPGAFDSQVVGRDRLVPVCAPDDTGAPRWVLDGGPAAPLLAYGEASGLARILKAALPRVASEPVFTAPLAATLQTMAREGQGLAWLPATLITDDLVAGRLVDAGGGAHAIPVEIRLFRAARHRSATAERFWAAV